MRSYVVLQWLSWIFLVASFVVNRFMAEGWMSSSLSSCAAHRFDVELLRGSSNGTDTNSPIAHTATPMAPPALTYRGFCRFPYAVTAAPYPSIDDALAYTASNDILYNCGANNTRFALTHALYNRVTGRTFSAESFLELMSNKIVVLLGDSTGRQLFEELQFELFSYQTSAQDFNITHWVNNPSLSAIYHSGMWSSRVRSYAARNVTLVFCQNSRLSSQRSSIAMEACGYHLAMADIVAVAGGVWYRPFEAATGGREEPLTHSDALQWRAKTFARLIRELRKDIDEIALSKQRPPPLVVWRLIPHTGRFDELCAIDSETHAFNSSCRQSYSKTDWDSVSQSAQWTLTFNDIIRDLVHDSHRSDQQSSATTTTTAMTAGAKRRDLLWDCFTTSNLFLDFLEAYRSNQKQQQQQQQQELAAETTRIKAHIDATHYCPRGVMRACLLPLFDILQRHYHPVPSPLPLPPI